MNALRHDLRFGHRATLMSVCVAVGVGASLWRTRLPGGLLYRVTPIDPMNVLRNG
jgi:hypothetical protein